MYFNLMKIYYDADRDGGSSGNGQSDNQSDDNSDNQDNDNQPATFKSFDEWYSSLPDNFKQLAGGAKDHFERMGNTVRDTRAERDALSENLKAISTLIGKKPEEATAGIEKLLGSLETSNRKADFYEAAPAVECKNPKAAFALATANNLWKRDGKPDWEAIKQEAPELFGAVTNNKPRKSSAGSGTDGKLPPAGRTMNDLIRRGAGVTITSDE